jgi:phosphoribosylanthranilate isomerase
VFDDFGGRIPSDKPPINTPWELAIEAKQRFPEKHFILAGGLVAENVAEAVAQVKPIAVDVASGVESSPGIKDLALVQRFIEQAQYTACR